MRFQGNRQVTRIQLVGGFETAEQNRFIRAGKVHYHLANFRCYTFSHCHGWLQVPAEPILCVSENKIGNHDPYSLASERADFQTTIASIHDHEFYAALRRGPDSEYFQNQFI
jgi:hypothetical protein